MPRGLSVESRDALAQQDNYQAQTALKLHASASDNLVGAGQLEVNQGAYKQKRMFLKGSN